MLAGPVSAIDNVGNLIDGAWTQCPRATSRADDARGPKQFLSSPADPKSDAEAWRTRQ